MTPRMTPIGTTTTGAQVSAGWSCRKRGSKTVFRNVAYMWGAPMRRVMRRSTPPTVVFPSEWTSGGTATSAAESVRQIKSQRGFAINCEGREDVRTRAWALMKSLGRERSAERRECSKGDPAAGPGGKIPRVSARPVARPAPVDPRLDLEVEIRRLKKERNAVVLAHYYQESEIQDLADFVGDSLELARRGKEASERVIAFAGVHFMAVSYTHLTLPT